MDQRHDDTWEHSLQQLARRFDYPPTPDIAAAIRQRAADRPQATDHRPLVVRRLAWGILIVFLFVAVALAAPQTRAAVLSLFARIGAIDIFIDETAPTPQPTTTSRPTVAPAVIASPAATAVPSPTAGNSVAHSLALHELGEPVGLEAAQRRAGFDLVVPSGLGEPDEVYTHRNVDLPAATLVWRDDEGAILSLTEIGIAEFARKIVGEDGAKYLMIGDHPAVWLEGPHLLQLFGMGERGSLFIDSNVLIWTAGGVTYRLEGDLSETEMIAIAETLAVAK